MKEQYDQEYNGDQEIVYRDVLHERNKCKFTQAKINYFFVTNVLYLSYDGLTDALGQSQVLPYLQGLAKLNYRITIVSLEKPMAYNAQAAIISQNMEKYGIQWVPVTYQVKPGIKNKYSNNRALKKAVSKVLDKQKIDFIHARSYPASLVAMKAAEKNKLPFIFDMRGFWADERVEGKIWNLKKPHHRVLYRYFKKKEKTLLAGSAHIVSLTQAAKNYMVNHFGRQTTEDKITVIPCCADLDHFILAPKNTVLRQQLGITDEQKVILYLGSVGTWYLLDEMIDFFNVFRKKHPGAVFLVVTQHHHDYVYHAFDKKQIGHEAYKVVSATRQEVPAYVACADAGLFFVRPGFSKTASSPVKMAELAGCGLPVFANTGIGDVDLDAKKTNELIIVDAFNETAYLSSIQKFAQLRHSPEAARQFALDNYSLEKGIDLYRKVYESMNSNRKAD